MRKLTPLILSVLLVGCATTAAYNKTSSDPGSSLRDQGAGDSVDPITSGLTAASVAMGTSKNKASEKALTISGRCLVRLDDLNQNLPCAGILLVLVDAKGSEVSRAYTTSDGTFGFNTQNNQKYFISPASKQYRVAGQRELVSGSADVLLQLEHVQ